MKSILRVTVTGTLLALLFFGTLADHNALAQQQTPGQGQGQEGGFAFGPRQMLESFFEAMQSADLVMLKNGGAVSGTTQLDQVAFTPTTGDATTYQRADMAVLTLGDSGDQIVLTTGDTVTGQAQLDSVTVALPSGQSLTIQKADIAVIVLKLNIPRPTFGGPGQAGGQSGQTPTPDQQRNVFRLFRGLQSQNLFVLFAKSVTTFDLAVFSDGEVWSGTFVNQQITFQSTLFGTLTLQPSDINSIQLGTDPTAAQDFVSMKTGDRITGTLDDSTGLQFQPVGLLDDSGQQATVTLQRGQVTRISFRQPASAFGSGGRGPGLGGGPGR